MELMVKAKVDCSRAPLSPSTDTLWLTDILNYNAPLSVADYNMSASALLMEESSTFKQTQLVRARLVDKYATAFHFYQVRPINQLLSAPDSPTAIFLNDLRALLDTTEFLRRLYSHRTLTGRPEIDHRIRLCADYYAKAAPRPSPTLLPDARSLLLRRGRRLKKIQAGEGSSDETEHHPDSFVEFSQQSSQFLPDLDRSSLDQDPSEECSSFLSEYDLFEECDVEKAQNYSLDLRQIDEGSLGHLITDLSQKIPQKSEKEDGESTACHSKPLMLIENKPLTTISNKSFEPTTSVIPIPSRKLQLQGRKNSHQAPTDAFLSSIVAGYENEDRRVALQGEKGELENRRRRIRQKAEELLRRAKHDIEEGSLP